jgi:hypothetical protein
MIPAMVDLLAGFYKTGHLDRMEAIARSMLVSMPDDVVALQFLGLALYLKGRMDDAYRTFKRASARFGDASPAASLPTTCESAASVSYREATRPDSGLADGWQRIAEILARFRFHKTAARALAAALAARSGPD